MKFIKIFNVLNLIKLSISFIFNSFLNFLLCSKELNIIYWQMILSAWRYLQILKLLQFLLFFIIRISYFIFKKHLCFTGNSSSSEAKPRWKDSRGFNSAQRPFLIPLNRLLNFWFWSDEFEKQARTRKVTSTVRGYLYPVHRTPTDDPIYGEGMGKVRVDK